MLFKGTQALPVWRGGVLQRGDHQVIQTTLSGCYIIYILYFNLLYCSKEIIKWFKFSLELVTLFLYNPLFPGVFSPGTLSSNAETATCTSRRPTRGDSRRWWRDSTKGTISTTGTISDSLRKAWFIHGQWCNIADKEKTPKKSMKYDIYDAANEVLAFIVDFWIGKGKNNGLWENHPDPQKKSAFLLLLAVCQKQGRWAGSGHQLQAADWDKLTTQWGSAVDNSWQ